MDTVCILSCIPLMGNSSLLTVGGDLAPPRPLKNRSRPLILSTNMDKPTMAAMINQSRGNWREVSCICLFINDVTSVLVFMRTACPAPFPLVAYSLATYSAPDISPCTFHSGVAELSFLTKISFL
uniref:Uncharacterized protein n=1 Tax=Cacopsylla melanoneura TaxID=428564 RepID=A0A8D8RW46_9HEMI